MKKIFIPLGLLLIGIIAYVASEKRIPAKEPTMAATPAARGESVTSTPKIESGALKDAPAPSSKQNEAPVQASAVSTEMASPEEQRAILRRNVDFTYGKAINGFGLTADEVVKLKGFLIAKGEATYIAKEVVKEERALGDMQSVVNEARAKVDEEMRAFFGDEKYARIEILQHSTKYLLMQKTEYEPELENAGIATLDSAQSYNLGALMQKTYGDSNSVNRANAAEASGGLSENDNEVLTNASGFLTPDQLSVLRSTLVARNRKFASKNHN